MKFKYSTTWNLSIPLHGIQIFHYMEFKHSTTRNSSFPLHGIQVFHYMEFKLAEWIRKFHHMKFMVPFTTNLKLTMDLTDFQCKVLDFYLFFIHTFGSISKYETEIMVSYSITHMSFLCSIAIWFCSDQYRFCLFH